MKQISWFVNGWMPYRGLFCDGPFETEEEAATWAKSHRYPDYKIVKEAWVAETPDRYPFDPWLNKKSA